jgi:hypothetical protein
MQWFASRFLLRLHPLTVRRPFLSRGVGALQRLEFAAQAGVFGSEICEFCARVNSNTGRE